VLHSAKAKIIMPCYSPYCADQLFQIPMARLGR
jgi:hypothetical protein